MSISAPLVLKPDRTVKARAVAAIEARQRALAAYADLTPIVLKLRGDGHSLRVIAGIFNGESRLTRNGKPFSAITIGRILARSADLTEKRGES